MLLHVMDTDDIGAGEYAIHICRDRSRQARRGRGLWLEDAAEKRLSRQAQEDRKTERLKAWQRRHGLIALLDGLAEADAGIEDDAVLWHSGGAGDEQRAFEEAENVGNDVDRR